MAKIKKLKENGGTIYPATILEAVLDSKTSTPLSKTRLRYTRASAHGRYYKFMSLKRGTEKGIVRFGIESPLMGYAEYMVNWTYDTNTEKGMNPYCLFSTNAQMYNRVKLVRTGNDTFDAYFESNAGNDYPAFVFMGEGGTTDSSSITGYIVSIVSAIPTVYKESTYVGNICFGTVTGTLAGTADNAAGISFANSDDAINIDEYPQAELGTIYIWLNGNQADGNVPNYPENGVVIQSHFRFENDEGEYKYRYTQMFVGKNGTLYSRTSVEDSTLGFTPSSWEEWNRSGCYYFYLGKMTVGSSGSSSTSVTFSSGSSVFPAMKALFSSYFPANSGYHIPDIQISFDLDTSAGSQSIRAKLLSHFRTSGGNDGLFFLYQNALHGGSNYLNILRITIDTSGTAACATIDMKI
jgi:hypothetical protein|nr:MAG TPA: hypothetical protein [Caudoviricetes sp.]